MRALTALTIVMGVLIVAGVAVLATALVYKAGAPAASTAWAASLDEPEGTSVSGLAQAGASLAIALRGGGADRVVLVDPRTGRVAGRLSVSR